MAVQNDWQFSPRARRCAVSGEHFEPGQSIICFLYQGETGELQRSDVLPEQSDIFKPEGLLLGKWKRDIDEGDGDEKNARKAMLVSNEELFFSILEEEIQPTDGNASETRELLLQVLALQLERKRILRSMGRPVDGVQTYLHVKTKQQLQVPAGEIEPQKLLTVQEQLSALVI